jgi:aryl-alcohol dehydrogenase-like predicted oxidoreductase
MLPKRKLGHLGLEVSMISLGCMGYGYPNGTPNNAQ